MFVPAAQLTHETAASQLAAGLSAIDAGQHEISLQAVQRVDSSAVACLLAWKRHAQQQQVNLTFQHLPQNLTHLMRLYGVDPLL